MKILIVSQYFWPENFRINQLAHELNKKGHNVLVYTGLPNYPEGKIYTSYKERKSFYKFFGNIKVIRIPVLPRGNNFFMLFINYLSFVIYGIILAPIKLRNEEFDIIFTFQTSPVFVGFVSTYIKWLKKVPNIMWVLDLWPDSLEAVNVIKSKLLLNQISKAVEFIYSNCDLLLVQSKGFINNIVNHSYDKKRIIYFPAWVDWDFDITKIRPAKEIKKEKEVFTIIFAGNIGIAQDFPSIIKACQLLTKKKIKYRLLIIGDGAMKTWLCNQIIKKGLGGNIKLLNKYPLERMPSFFAHADALLVSLLDKKVLAKTIPGKIQTYLTTGKPIIGMLNGEGAKVIENSNSGLTCNAGKYNLLSKIIIKMTNLNKSDLQKYGENGRKYAISNFDKNSSINNLEKILIDLKSSKNK